MTTQAVRPLKLLPSNLSISSSGTWRTLLSVGLLCHCCGVEEGGGGGWGVGGDTIGRPILSLQLWGWGTLLVGLCHCSSGGEVGDTIGRPTLSLLGGVGGALSVGLLCHCWVGWGGTIGRPTLSLLGGVGGHYR